MSSSIIRGVVAVIIVGLAIGITLGIGVSAEIQRKK